MATLTYTEMLETLTCYKCGITFAMPGYFMQKRRDLHDAFYCPSGHSQHYPAESEAERLSKQLAATRAQLDQEKAAVRDKEKQLAKAKAEMKTLCKNGKCPCCRRNFQNLKRHMATKHPEFAEAK